MSSAVPRGEIVVGLPLLAGALAAIPLADPYAQWLTGGPCRELPPTVVQAVTNAVLLAVFGAVPFLFGMWPARWLRGGRTIVTALLPLLIAFVLQAALVFPAVQNPLSTFLIDHMGVRSPSVVSGLILTVIAIVGVAPIWMTLAVRADTTPPRFEALLASCGLWLVVAATIARFFRAAQVLPLGLAAPVVLAVGLATTLHALVRRRVRATHHARDDDGPYRRDAKEGAPLAGSARGARVAQGRALERLLGVDWWPTRADKVERPCPGSGPRLTQASVGSVGRRR
jgi:hypothetical protein